MEADAEMMRVIIADLKAERDGLREMVRKQAAQVRQLQKRLAKAGLDAGLERQSIER